MDLDQSAVSSGGWIILLSNVLTLIVHFDPLGVFPATTKEAARRTKNETKKVSFILDFWLVDWSDWEKL